MSHPRTREFRAMLPFDVLQKRLISHLSSIFLLKFFLYLPWLPYNTTLWLSFSCHIHPMSVTHMLCTVLSLSVAYCPLLWSADRISTLSFPTFTLTRVVLYTWNDRLILLSQDVYPFHIRNLPWVHNFWKAADICPSNASSLHCGAKPKAVKGRGKWTNVIELMRLSTWVYLDCKLSGVGIVRL